MASDAEQIASRQLRCSACGRLLIEELVLRDGYLRMRCRCGEMTERRTPAETAAKGHGG